jgi:type 1 glutamine amidotransferase
MQAAEDSYVESKKFSVLVDGIQQLLGAHKMDLLQQLSRLTVTSVAYYADQDPATKVCTGGRLQDSQTVHDADDSACVLQATSHVLNGITPQQGVLS